MAKKKKEQQQVKKEIEQVIRNGKCQRCGKSLIKNHRTCVSCRKIKRLKKKANRRGLPKNYYLS